MCRNINQQTRFHFSGVLVVHAYQLANDHRLWMVRGVVGPAGVDVPELAALVFRSLPDTVTIPLPRMGGGIVSVNDGDTEHVMCG